MSDGTEKEGGAATLDAVVARLEELTREVRRQGRAAVAAQAAAESCLEKLGEVPAPEAAAEADRGDAGEARAGEDLLRALLPVADALDRVVSQAGAMLERTPPPPPPPPRRGLFSWVAGAPPPPPPPWDRGSEIAALADGLRVLRAQLGEALGSLDVRIDRRTGVAIDPAVHRVVEARAVRGGERADTVLEIVRPGYAIGDRVIREAEVVAGTAPKDSR